MRALDDIINILFSLLILSEWDLYYAFSGILVLLICSAKLKLPKTGSKKSSLPVPTKYIPGKSFITTAINYRIDGRGRP